MLESAPPNTFEVSFYWKGANKREGQIRKEIRLKIGVPEEIQLSDQVSIRTKYAPGPKYIAPPPADGHLRG